MKYLLYVTALVIATYSLSCKKQYSTDLGMCDLSLQTVFKADNWSGNLSYYSDLKKWAVNVHINNTIDGLRTCIICPDIPDSLKTVGRTVTFSGDVKESNGKPAPLVGGQEIYIVLPTKLK